MVHQDLVKTIDMVFFQLLLQDLQKQLHAAADDKARAVILRKMRRAIDAD